MQNMMQQTMLYAYQHLNCENQRHLHQSFDDEWIKATTQHGVPAWALEKKDVTNDQYIKVKKGQDTGPCQPISARWCWMDQVIQWFCPHTLGRYSKLPQTHKQRNSMKFLHKRLVKRPGYLPAVCGWDLTVKKLMLCFLRNDPSSTNPKTTKHNQAIGWPQNRLYTIHKGNSISAWNPPAAVASICECAAVWKLQ